MRARAGLAIRPRRPRASSPRVALSRPAAVPYDRAVIDRRVARRAGPALSASTWSHVRLWVLVVVLAFAVATAGYMLLGGWNLSDAFYMAAITLTTVGFREVRDLDEPLRLWTTVVAIAGVGIIFGDDRAHRGTRARGDEREEGGEARVGPGGGDARPLRALWLRPRRVHRRAGTRDEGHPAVVVDGNEASLAHAQRDGFLAVAGDATDDATLLAAGIERAHGLIATMDSDANNVYVILSARALNPGLFIVGRASSADALAKMRRAGADRVVSPYTMAGRRLAALASRPRVVDFLDQALSHGQSSAFHRGAGRRGRIAPRRPRRGRPPRRRCLRARDRPRRERLRGEPPGRADSARRRGRHRVGDRLDARGAGGSPGTRVARPPALAASAGPAVAGAGEGAGAGAAACRAAAGRRPPPSACQHAVDWPPPTSMSGGSSARQRSKATGHRGWNRQPAGMCAASGVSPARIFALRPHPRLRRLGSGRDADERARVRVAGIPTTLVAGPSP